MLCLQFYKRGGVEVFSMLSILTNLALIKCYRINDNHCISYVTQLNQWQTAEHTASKNMNQYLPADVIMLAIPPHLPSKRDLKLNTQEVY